jgi:hypothetical protein
VVAIVNEDFARKVYGNAAVVGQHFRVAQNETLSEPVEIVGVVGDTKWGSLREASQPIVYYALSQMERPDPGLSYALRTTGDAAALAAGVRAAITEFNPRLVLTSITLEPRVGDSLRLPRTIAALAASFGSVSLVLATIGLYGVMAYTVSRRRNEIGVRLALGAARSRVIGMVLGDTGRTALLPARREARMNPVVALRQE